MSVIRFTEREMLEIEGMVLHHLGKIMPAIQHSSIYHDKFYWASQLEKGKVDEEKLVKEVLARLFWYLWVANKTAYALQYRKEPNFFGDTSDKGATIQSRSLKQLREKLGSLGYNLFTNDGHYFVSEEWYELFKAIKDHIDSKLIYEATERHLE